MSKNKKYKKITNIRNEIIESLTKLKTGCDSLLGQEEDIRKVLNGITGQANFKCFQEIIKDAKDLCNNLPEDKKNQYKESVAKYRLEDNQCIELLQALRYNFNGIMECLNEIVLTKEEAQILDNKIKLYIHFIYGNLCKLSIISCCLYFIGTNFSALTNNNAGIETLDYTTLSIALAIRTYIFEEFEILQEKMRRYNYERNL